MVEKDIYFHNWQEKWKLLETIYSIHPIYNSSTDLHCSWKKFLTSLKQLILHSKEMLDPSSINGRVDYAFTHT